ncbi:MAG: hypothetical protein OHK0039_07620 [Bacteroidia bacterium]
MGLLKLLCSLLIGLPYALSARVSLHGLFGDHMVLQQSSLTPVWGWADPGEPVAVSASWDQQRIQTYADSRGRWRVDLATPAAGGPFVLRVEGRDNSLAVSDVLVGEVWLAAGQSNMAWPLSASAGGDSIAALAQDPHLRFFQVPQEVALTARADVRGRWVPVAPASAGSHSAVAYYFAQTLRQRLGVPVGIIQSTWGGTPAEAWTSREALRSDTALRPLLDAFDERLRRYRADPSLPDPLTSGSPAALFHTMIAPLVPYSIEGVIWYQGESNTHDAYLYRRLFPALIQDWRRQWGWRLSFYFVQIAPFRYDVPLSGAAVREAQAMALALPNTGMVSTLDLGDPDDIHPRRKREVGERLARWALYRNYGQDSVAVSGPLYAGTVRRGTRLGAWFTQGSGLYLRGEAGLEVAGSDRRFFPAQPQIEGDTLWLASDSVAAPEALRYAFADTACAALYNAVGLPAPPFRSDDWPLFIARPRIEATFLPDQNSYRVAVSYPLRIPHQLCVSSDGSDPDTTHLYQGATTVPAPAQIRARVYLDGQPDPQVVSDDLLLHAGMRARVLRMTPLDPRYPGKGATTVIDGLQGSEQYDDGRWLGFEGKDWELLLDFGRTIRLHRVQATFLADHPVWIIHPQTVELSASRRGRKYDTWPVLELEQKTAPDYRGISACLWVGRGQRIRYLRIVATGTGALPDWHPAAGRPGWLFVDEVMVE